MPSRGGNLHNPLFFKCQPIYVSILDTSQGGCSADQLETKAKSKVPDCGDKVDSDIGLIKVDSGIGLPMVQYCKCVEVDSGVDIR